MYATYTIRPTSIKQNIGYEGETLEIKIERLLSNKEPIETTSPLLYTDRKDGIQASYNIRTDRFEVAVEAMDIVAKSLQAKREERAKARESIVTDIEAGNPKV